MKVEWTEERTRLIDANSAASEYACAAWYVLMVVSGAALKKLMGERHLMSAQIKELQNKLKVAAGWDSQLRQAEARLSEVHYVHHSVSITVCLAQCV